MWRRRGGMTSLTVLRDAYGLSGISPGMLSLKGDFQEAELRACAQHWWAEGGKEAVTPIPVRAT
ncbi:hypothetical protein GCM10011415_11700 [Salipiger pallidus]|uniref:Uncharacterized protein n=1 Tax=Salipiger pallidus TaxID=1775170 RepID=A0A8J2ZIH6_9RHOB|nr:hypothetical protein GCM10011415_11700 [Salipiger pallidus]